MSLEKTAKGNIKLLYPEAYVEGSFAKRVMGAYTSSFDGPERLGVVPDCYFHFWFPHNDQDGGVDYFIVCEIEDTNPLTEEKLSIYGQLWDDMHCNLNVWSFNRYGQFTTSHNLLHWYSYRFNRNEDTGVLGPSIDINMREPLFPDNEKFFEGEHPPCDHWKNYKPWSEERRLRLFKNTKDLKKSYSDEVVYDENGKAGFLN
jgi:hypothetical protein